MEKQVFSWRAIKVQICCIITFRSRFSHDAPKTLIFDALLHGKAGFLMTRQKGANLWHYYVSKQVFSWRTKNSYIWCIITWKSRFSHDAPKRCSFVALLPGKADFLMTCQNSGNLVHYYAEKQVFSRRNRKQSANLLHYNVLKQVFSWRAKTLLFDALIGGKVRFLMTRNKGANLLHYYVSKQVFSWRTEKSYILMH